MDGIICSSSADVRQFLFPNGVHHEILSFVVHAEDHSFIERLAGMNEDFPAILKTPQRIGHGLTSTLRNLYARSTPGNLAFEGLVLTKRLGHDAGPTGHHEQVTAKPHDRS